MLPTRRWSRPFTLPRSGWYCQQLSLRLMPPSRKSLMHVRFVSTVLGKTTLVASYSPAASAPDDQQAKFTSFVYTASPQVHGLIREQPRTIAELQAYLSGSDVDFTNALRRYLSDLKAAQGFNRSLQLLIIVRLPKLRTATEAIETVEVWAFASVGTLADLGTDLGIWTMHENLLADLYPIDFACTGQHSRLELLSPVRALTRDLAAAYNGLLPTTTRYVAIGAGSLGSQVVNNLVRAGQGTWVWLDEDHYLPHNAARHYLPSSLVGLGKAHAMGIDVEEYLRENGLAGHCCQCITLSLRPANDGIQRGRGSTRYVSLSASSPALSVGY